MTVLALWRRPVRPRPELSTARAAPLLVGLSLLLVLVVCAGLGIGAVAISPSQLVAIIAKRLGMALPGVAFAPSQEAVLFAIRVPRVLLGVLVGGALAAGGAAVQALFRNPLADPALIGTASGAALAAALVIVLLPAPTPGAADWWRVMLLPLAAFGGSVLTTGAVYRIAGRAGHVAVTTLLLAGIAVNALAGAGTGLLSFVASDAQLRSLVFWSLGSLGGATWSSLAGVAPWLLLALVGLPMLAPSLNLLLLGECEARHLGVDIERLKRRIVVLAALGVGAAVAVSGVIGFVGLVVPHLVRLAVGPDHRLVLPGSIVLGAALLVGADLLARTAAAPAELPIGIVTAFTGAPFFLWLLRRVRA